MLARSRRLHGRVQRQQFGLPCNLLHQRDELPDLLRCRRQCIGRERAFAHVRGECLELLRALVESLVIVGRERAQLRVARHAVLRAGGYGARRFGELARVARELLDAPSHGVRLLAQRARRVRNAARGQRHVLGALRDFGRKARRFGRCHRQQRRQIAEFARHGRHRARETPKLASLAHGGWRACEVSRRHCLRHFGQLAQLAPHHRRNQPAKRECACDQSKRGAERNEQPEAVGRCHARQGCAAGDKQRDERYACHGAEPCGEPVDHVRAHICLSYDASRRACSEGRRG